ncbi:putative transcriptional regulatory protein, LysR family (fragment) [Bradyrhizobium sp. ORS 375]
MADDLASGRLETVLPDVMTIKAPLMAVYPSRKYLSAKVRTFIDFIAADPLMKQASEGPAAAIDRVAVRARKGRNKRA